MDSCMRGKITEYGLLSEWYLFHHPSPNEPINSGQKAKPTADITLFEPVNVVVPQIIENIGINANNAIITLGCHKTKSREISQFLPIANLNHVLSLRSSCRLRSSTPDAPIFGNSGDAPSRTIRWF